MATKRYFEFSEGTKKLGSDGEARKLHDRLVDEKGGAEPEIIVIPEGAMRLEVAEGKSAKFWQMARPLAKSVEHDGQDDPSDHRPDPEDPDEDDSWWRHSRVGE